MCFFVTSTTLSSRNVRTPYLTQPYEVVRFLQIVKLLLDVFPKHHLKLPWIAVTDAVPSPRSQVPGPRVVNDIFQKYCWYSILILASKVSSIPISVQNWPSIDVDIYTLVSVNLDINTVNCNVCYDAPLNALGIQTTDTACTVAPKREHKKMIINQVHQD